MASIGINTGRTNKKLHCSALWGSSVGILGSLYLLQAGNARLSTTSSLSAPVASLRHNTSPTMSKEKVFFKILGSSLPVNATRESVVRESACRDQWSDPADPVILRMTRELTEVKQQIITRYSLQLKDSYDLWVLFDASDVSPDDMGSLEASLQQFQLDLEYPPHIMLYDTELGEHMFPAASRYFKKGLSPSPDPINYIVHSVSIVMWWRLCGHRNWGDVGFMNDPLPTAVWNVEPDAAFAGDVTQFFEYYNHKGYDLIMNSISNAPDDYLQEISLSDTFNIPPERLFLKWDFVVRLSSKLLYHLELMMKSGIILYGELYESTLCKGLWDDWCTHHVFEDDGFSGSVLDPNRCLTSTEWEYIQENITTRNRWYHAVGEFKENQRWCI